VRGQMNAFSDNSAATQQNDHIPSELIQSGQEADLRGFTKTAFECIAKSQLLAREMNHETICPAHLIVAMAVTARATERFAAHGLNADLALSAALQALGELERADSSKIASSSSEEFKVILNSAMEAADIRDNQDASLDDLVKALAKIPEDEPTGKLLRNNTKSEIAEIRTALSELSSNLLLQIEDLKRSLSSSNQEMRLYEIERSTASSEQELRLLRQDMNHLEQGLENRFSELKTTIGELKPSLTRFVSPTTPVVPEVQQRQEPTIPGTNFQPTEPGPRTWGTPVSQPTTEPVQTTTLTQETNPPTSPEHKWWQLGAGERS
jgi:hypothetical protein